jgi:hypothetical protein
MKCQVIKTNTNEIKQVLAPNGKESTLYNNLLNNLEDREEAVRQWSSSSSIEIINYLIEKSNLPLDSNKVKTLLDLVQSNNDFNKFFNTNRELIDSINSIQDIDINTLNNEVLNYLNDYQQVTNVNDNLITAISNNSLNTYSINDTLYPIQEMLDMIAYYNTTRSNVSNSLSSNYQIPNSTIQQIIDNFDYNEFHEYAANVSDKYRESYYNETNTFLPPFANELQFINDRVYSDTLEFKDTYVQEFNKNLQSNDTLNEAKKIAKGLLGNNVVVDTIFDTFNKTGIAGGMFVNDIISLHKEAPNGIIYHELFHKVFRTLLTNEEIEHYLDRAKSEYELDYNKLQQLAKEYSYLNLTEQELVDLTYEEMMADEYMNFALNNQYPKGWLLSLFNLIKNFFMKILGRRTEIDALFHKINNKGFLNKQRKTNKFILSMPVFKLLVEDKEGKQSSESLTSQIIADVAGLLHESLENNTNNESVQTLFDNVLKELVTYYNVTPNGGHYAYIKALNSTTKEAEMKSYLAKMRHLYSFAENKATIWEGVATAFNTYEYNPVKGEYIDYDAVETESDNGVADNREMLALTASEKNSFSSAPKSFKQFIGFVMYDTTDEVTGLPIRRAVDGKNVHTTLVKSLASQDLWHDEVLPKIKQIADRGELEIKAVYNKLLEKTNGDSEHPLIAAVRAAVNLEKMKPQEMLINPEMGSFLVQNSLKQNSEEDIITQWLANWDNMDLSTYYETRIENDKSKSKDKFNNLAILFNDPNYDSITINSVRIASGYDYTDRNGHNIEIPSIYEFTGMNLNVGYIRFSMLSNMQDKSSFTSEDTLFLETMEEAGMTPLTAKDLSQIQHLLYSSNDELQKDFEKEANQSDVHNLFINREKGVYGRTKVIAASNSILDNNTELMSFQDPIGNTRYGFVQKSFDLTELRRLKNPEYRKAKAEKEIILAGNYFLSLPSEIQDTLFGDSWEALDIGYIRQTTVDGVDHLGKSEKGKKKEDKQELIKAKDKTGDTAKTISPRDIEIMKLAYFFQVNHANFNYQEDHKTKTKSGVEGLPLSTFDIGVIETKQQIPGRKLPSKVYNAETKKFERAVGTDGNITNNSLEILRNMLLNEVNSINKEGQYFVNNYNSYIEHLNKVLYNQGLDSIDEVHKKLADLNYLNSTTMLDMEQMDELNSLRKALAAYEAVPNTKLLKDYHLRYNKEGKMIHGRSTELWHFKSILNMDTDGLTEEQVEAWDSFKNYLTNLQKLFVKQAENKVEQNQVTKELNNAAINDLNTEIQAYEQNENSDINKSAMKAMLNKFMMNEVKGYTKLLANYNIVDFNSNGEVMSGSTFPKAPTFYYELNEENRIANVLADYVVTHFISVTAYNDLIDGNHAKTKDSFDRVKRNGGGAAYGPNAGRGEANVAIMEDSSLINVFGGKQKERGDAGAYMTLDRWRFLWKRIGKGGIKALEPILNKVRFGTAISWNEKMKLEQYDNMLNSVKGVYYDGNNYHKLSYTILTREFTSNLIKGQESLAKELSNQILAAEAINDYAHAKMLELKFESLWQPIQGRELLHNLRQSMLYQNVDEVLPQSASKINTVIPAKEVKGKYDFTYAKIKTKNENWRLQVEVPTGKLNITYFTQVLQLIDNEQNLDAIVEFKGKTMTVREVRNQYRTNLANRIKNAVEQALNELVDVDENGDYQRNDKKTINFYNRAVETLLLSGSDSTLLNFFKTTIDGTASDLFNLNLPATERKFEQLFLSHFSGGVLQAKVPGRKMSLVPDVGMNIPVDENDNVIRQEFIIPDVTYRTRRLKWSTEEVTEGNQVKQRTLTECLMPPWTMELYNIKSGDLIDSNHAAYNDIMTMFGTRIPSQDKHSMVAFKVVDFLPVYMGDVAIFPAEITYLSGADFDIDSLYAIRKDFYTEKVKMEDGTTKTKFIVYGEDQSEVGLWKDFLQYTKKYNKAVMHEYKDSIKPANNVALKELYKQTNTATTQIREKSSKVKANNTLVNELKAKIESVKFDLTIASTEPLAITSNLDNQQYKALELYNQIVSSKAFKQLINTRKELDKAEKDYDKNVQITNNGYLETIDRISTTYGIPKDIATIDSKIKAGELSEDDSTELVEYDTYMQQLDDNFNSIKAEKQYYIEQSLLTISNNFGIDPNEVDSTLKELTNIVGGKKQLLNLRNQLFEAKKTTSELYNEINKYKEQIADLYDLNKGLQSDIKKLVADNAPLYKQIESVKSDMFLKAMRMYNIPTNMFDFIHTENYRTMNNGILHNQLVDNNILLYINSSVSEITTTPATMAKIQEDIVKDLANLHGTNVESYVYNSTLGQAIARASGRIGKELIGLGAIANIVKAALARNGVTLNADKFVLNYDGLTLTNFANFNTKDVEFVSEDSKVVNAKESMRIMDEISALISAFTDSAKHNDPAKLNFTMSGSNVWLYMVSLGYGLTRTALVSKQNIMYDYDKLSMISNAAVMSADEEIATRGNITTKLFDKYTLMEQALFEAINSRIPNELEAINALKNHQYANTTFKLTFDDTVPVTITETDKYGKEKSKTIQSVLGNIDEQFKSNEFNSQYLREALLTSKHNKEVYGIDFTDNTFINNLSNMKFADMVNNYITIKVQLNVLNNFQKMDSLSKGFTQLSKILAMNKGLKPSFNDNQSIVEAIEYFGIRVVNGKIITSSPDKATFDIQSIIDNEPDFSELLLSWFKINKVSSKFFISQTPLFKNLFNIIQNNNTGFITDKSKMIQTTKSSIMNYITMLLYRKTKSLPNANLLYGDADASDESKKPLQTRLKDLVKLVPSLGNNFFIKKLGKTLDENTHDITQYNGNQNDLDSDSKVKNPISTLTFNTRVKNSAKTNDRLMNAYLELLSYNDSLISDTTLIEKLGKPEQSKELIKTVEDRKALINQLAIDLFDYLVLKDGLQFKNKSFIKYVPATMYKSISDSMNKLNEIASDTQWSNEIQDILGISEFDFTNNFINLYARNPFNRPNMIDTSYDRLNSTIKHLVDTQGEPLITGYGINNEQSTTIDSTTSKVEIDLSILQNDELTLDQLYDKAFEQLDKSYNDKEVNGIPRIDYLRYEFSYVKDSLIDKSNWGNDRRGIIAEYNRLLVPGSETSSKLVTEIADRVGHIFKARGAKMEFPRYIIIGKNPYGDDATQNHSIFMLSELEGEDKEGKLIGSKATYVKVTPIYTQLNPYLYTPEELKATLLDIAEDKYNKNNDLEYIYNELYTANFNTILNIKGDVEASSPFKLKKEVKVNPLNNTTEEVVEPTSKVQEELFKQEPQSINNQPVTMNELISKKNIFTVTPIQSADTKAIAKSSIATKYIGYGEGIAGSSTEHYRIQAGQYANVGTYNSKDVVFVSVGGRRGNEQVRKVQQNKTILEAIKALEQGATILTDNKVYTDNSNYNEGEKRLKANLESKGYQYSEITIDGQLLGVWQKLQSLDNQPITTDSNTIYNQLGNKTVSGNVIIKPVYQKEGIAYAKSIDGVFSLRVNNNNTNFGNPFSSDVSEVTKNNLIQTNSTKESVQKYIDWLTTDKYNNVQPERRAWIIKQLQSGVLKGKPIVYYKELNEPSHATALDYLINKYDWNTQTIDKTGRDSIANKTLINSDRFKALSKELQDFILVIHTYGEGSVDISNIDITTYFNKLSNTDKVELTNLLNKDSNKRIKYKLPKELYWDNMDWSSTDAESMYYYLVTGSDLDTDVYNEYQQSPLLQEFNDWVSSNKEYVTNTVKLPDNLKVEHQKDLDKLMEIQKDYQSKLGDYSYDLRQSALNNVNYFDNTILQSPEYQSFRQNELSKNTPITEEDIFEMFKKCHYGK